MGYDFHLVDLSAKLRLNLRNNQFYEDFYFD